MHCLGRELTKKALQIRLVDPKLEKPLARFFESIRRNGDDRFFHPHPFTEEYAQHLANYNGVDLYYVLLEGDRVIGYGMLRGWDEGYSIPSLGIIIAKTARRNKLGSLLMQFLHNAARSQGAERIRLKVYFQNSAAVAFYEMLGYRFETEESQQLVGYLDL